MIIYNKLVRDNIPSIIEKDNKLCTILTLNGDQFLVELKKKLVEEAREVIDANSKDEIINEIADIHEIIGKLSEILEITKEEIQEAQNKKALKNGKFDKKILLVSVQTKNE